MSSPAQIHHLLQCLDLEEKAQAARYRLDQQHTLKALKAEGLALHPITVTRRSFGYADYPEISFRLAYPAETNLFRDGSAIECFIAGEEPVKGVLLSLEGNAGEFRLFAPDFPDWLEDRGVGLKLAPDTRTTDLLKKALQNLPNHRGAYRWFCQWHNEAIDSDRETLPSPSGIGPSSLLNDSQQQAAAAIAQNHAVVIVHGPPGTGKTTTLKEAIVQLVQQGEKVLVSAPSNAAVDHLCRQLLQKGVSLLRVGNTSKAGEDLIGHTPEGRMAGSSLQKEIKQLRIRADEFRRMAHKYKRQFGPAEREQRKLLFREVKSIHTEIRKLQAYFEEKLYAEANVIAGTPVGLYDAGLQDVNFDTLVIDEAAQCLEPMAWLIIPMAEKLVLAGDHHQLPPTVLSQEAIKLGFSRSILEVAIEKQTPVYLLNTQYRMHAAIAGFSSQYFYDGRLQSAPHLQGPGTPVCFIDTAGSGFSETHGPDGVSLQNEGELRLAAHWLKSGETAAGQWAFIAPYAGQVAAARAILPEGMRISTVDSFQGQEHERIMISLVRSNDEGDIGFLKDYRRMNVAITRAKQQLVVIGDSATIGADPFYAGFLRYVEAHGEYRSVWEFDLG